MSTSSTVGIVGLGRMGRPVGRHLLGAGYSVIGYDPVEAARVAGASLGIEIVASPAEIGRRADLAFVLVGFDDEVEAALFRDDGVLSAPKAGLAVAIGSTISPTYAHSLARRVEALDIGLIDLPSARGEAALEAGEILLFGAGDEVLFET